MVEGNLARVRFTGMPHDWGSPQLGQCPCYMPGMLDMFGNITPVDSQRDSESYKDFLHILSPLYPQALWVSKPKPPYQQSQG